MWNPVTALMSCAVMRTLCADRRTLPSSTVATLSLCATVAMSGCSLNEKDEVRAALQLVDLGERIEQLLRQPIREVLLLLVATEIDEGQHRDGMRRRIEGGNGI